MKRGECLSVVIPYSFSPKNPFSLKFLDCLHSYPRERDDASFGLNDEI